MLPSLPQADLEHVFTHAGGCMEDMRGKKLLITGGTGFFGIWLTESFLHANERLGLGAEVTVLSRAPSRFLERLPHLANRKGLRFITGNIRNFQFPAERFSYVIHAAADVGGRVANEQGWEVFDTIVEGTRRLLQWIDKGRPERLLFVSSGAVYGSQTGLPTGVSEAQPGALDPLQSASTYGIAKLAAEHLCALSAQKSHYELKIARCFAFVGPHLPLDGPFAIGNFIRDALKRREIRITGDGRAVRSYLYAADLAIWLWTLLLQNSPNVVYNVGSSKAISIGQLGRMVADICHLPNPEPISVGTDVLPSLYLPNVERAKRELGLIQWIETTDGISRTLSWLNPIDQ